MASPGDTVSHDIPRILACSEFQHGALALHPSFPPREFETNIAPRQGAPRLWARRVGKTTLVKKFIKEIHRNKTTASDKILVVNGDDLIARKYLDLPETAMKSNKGKKRWSHPPIGFLPILKLTLKQSILNVIKLNLFR